MSVLLSGQLLAAALVLAALYALVAMGLNLVYGTMRLLNIAHGELVMLGGYITYWSFTRLGISPILSMVVAPVLGACLGAVIYVVLFRRLLRSPKLAARVEANSLLIFFGVSVIFQNVMALLFTSTQRGYVYLNQVIQIGSVAMTANRLILFGVATSACLLCLAFFRYTRAGSAVRAVIQQRDAAALVGIDIDRLNIQVFALGFALAALAGVLVSMVQEITPFIGFPFTISAFVIITLGGLGNLFGSLLGALLLAAVEVYGTAIISSSFRSILVYGVFIAVLIVKPEGLLGRAVVAR
jgi:branched-chain amino acid transport system permease protein